MFQTLPWWIQVCKLLECRFQWPRGVRSGSAAARLLGLWVRIALGAWMFVSCECCVLSGRGSLHRCPEEPTECDVSECNREASMMMRPWPTGSCCAMGGGFVAIIDEKHFKYESDDFLRSKRCQWFMNQSTEVTEREREGGREGGRNENEHIWLQNSYLCTTERRLFVTQMYLTPAFAWRVWEKLRNTSGWIRGTPGNVLTNRVLPNTNVATAVSVYSVVML